MLTAVILKNPDSDFYAPGLFLSDRYLNGLLIQTAGFIGGDREPVWLADRAAGAYWPSGQVFETVGSQLLPWIDTPDDCWLLCAAENLRMLLPQAHRLVILEYPVAAGLRPAEKLAGLTEPALSGYLLAKQSLLTDPSGRTAGVLFWSRPSAIQVLSDIIAGGDCDLHLHTRCSDGTDTPGQTVDRVLASGLRAFAITDHDTLAALEPARQHLRFMTSAAERAQSGFLPPVMLSGVELSVESVEEQHLLGYFPYGNTAGIASFLNRQQESRRQRNEKMIRQLQSLGYPISQADFASSGEGTVGRLQAALLLRNLGYFPSIDAAFDELLSVGRPAYIDRVRPSAAEAIWLIRQAGGVAVLAHPGLYGWCGGRPIV
ncbi:MAG TPA: hypothetical protein DD640_05810, partial [Clostridiales bacterium]|nr:hypothetical protein [Clostridiales bacterium]